MKLHPAAISILATMLWTSTGFSTAKTDNGDHTHILMAEAEPIRNVDVRDNAIWDLSKAEKLRFPAAILTAYADTLLSETVNGVRSWYELEHDQGRLVRQESRILYQIPDNPVMTIAVGNRQSVQATAPHEEAYVTHGSHSSSFHVARKGILTSYAPIGGRLVVADGDTLAAWMTIERSIYREKTFPDTLRQLRQTELDSLALTDITRYRWFTHGNVPVAVQTEILRKGLHGNGDSVESETHAYIMDYSVLSETLCEDEQERDSDQNGYRALEGVRASYHDGSVTIDMNTPVPIDVRFDLMSDSGIRYAETSFTADGETTLNIPCGHLPFGRYVASFSIPGHIKKIFIISE